jgi:hypothetical protein
MGATARLFPDRQMITLNFGAALSAPWFAVNIESK